MLGPGESLDIVVAKSGTATKRLLRVVVEILSEMCNVRSLSYDDIKQRTYTLVIVIAVIG